jgi:hypothetical protein
LLTFPLPHIVAGVPIGQAGLTENGMLEGKALFVAVLWPRNQSFMDAAKGVHLLRRFHGGKVAQNICQAGLLGRIAILISHVVTFHYLD